MSTSSNLSPAELPPPPMAVVNQNTGEQAALEGSRFKSLLNLIGGSSRKRRSRFSKKRRSSRRYRTSRRRSRQLYSQRRRRRHRTKRRYGGAVTPSVQQVPVVTVPEPYNSVSYPNTTQIQAQLAGTIAQNNANAKLDAVGV